MHEILVAILLLTVWTSGGLLVAMFIGRGKSGGIRPGGHRLYAIAFLLTGFALMMFHPEIENDGVRFATMIWATCCIFAFFALAYITAHNLHKNKENHEYPDPH